MGNKCFKIALVNPKDTTIPIEDYSVYENLGLATLAATLRTHGYQVRIIDGYAENLNHAVVADKVVKFDPNLVGFTCTYQSYPDVLEIGRKIKRQLPSVHLTIGGEHATFTVNEILTESGIFDSVVRGEGEETLLELATAMEFSKPLKSIRGIHFKYNGGISANPDRPAIQDLDTLPYAFRYTLEYGSESGKSFLILIGMLAIRGC
ncbi:MAG: cobalamin-dependent protein [Nitrospirota bacterium]